MSGLEIRAAEAADHAEYVRLFAELGVDDAPVSAAKFAQEMVPTATFAERAGKVVGFAFWRPFADTTHLSQLVSRPRPGGPAWAASSCETSSPARRTAAPRA